MNKFPWGKVIDTFTYDFDGIEVSIVKFHPWNHEYGSRKKTVDVNKIEYHCEEISQSSNSPIVLLLAWIVEHQLGMNQGALTQGIARMLNLSDAI